jgi:hypothetical protein
MGGGGGICRWDPAGFLDGLFAGFRGEEEEDWSDVDRHFEAEKLTFGASLEVNAKQNLYTD